MAATIKTKAVTGKVRFSYVQVFQPKAKEDGGALKYSTALLIPKSDKDTVAKINKAIEDCKEANKAMFGGSIKGLKGGLRDGDEEEKARSTRVCTSLMPTQTASLVLLTRT